MSWRKGHRRRSWAVATCGCCVWTVLTFSSTAAQDTAVQAGRSNLDGQFAPIGEDGAPLSKSGADLPTIREICFTSFDPSRGLLSEVELRRHLETIDGLVGRIHTATARLPNCAAIDGLVRYRETWSDDMALRLWLEDYDGLQIHLYRGEQGVSLRYLAGDGKRWVGYSVQRKPGEVTPSRWLLAATDDGRNRRSLSQNQDQYELRCAGGKVILSRGDVCLLRLPFSGRPDAIYLEGKATLPGLAIVRTRDGWPDEELPRAGGERSLRELAPGLRGDTDARFERLADGGLRLSPSTTAPRECWLAIPRPLDACSEIVLEISDATPGSGIYLGDGIQPPHCWLRYAREMASGHLCILAGVADGTIPQAPKPVAEAYLPSVAPRHWLRLVFGVGQLRWWVSPDGLHWAEPTQPLRVAPAKVTHVGVHCSGNEAAQSITLRSVVGRDLVKLASTVPIDVLRQSSAVPPAATLADWRTDVARQAPTSIGADVWQRACALRTLAAGTVSPFGNELLLWLVDETARRDAALEYRLALLDEAALLLDVWNDDATLRRLAQRFHAYGLEAFEREQVPPFSAIRHALLTTPVATRHELEIATEELLRAELVALVYGRKWLRVTELARELRFYQLQSRSTLLDWAVSLAWRNVPSNQPPDAASYQRKDAWRDPLVEEISRDVYNVLAQLRVELAAAEQADAARTIAAIDGVMPGIAPHWRDDQLLVSLTTAIESAMREDPLLRKQMRETFADLGRYRVGEAITRQNANSVAFSAFQFAGTEAASDAHAWLAHRSLARGDFEQAASQYGLALRSAPAGLQPAISDRQQMATALDLQSSANARRRASWPALPPAGAYRASRHARLDGWLGNDPQRELVRDVHRRRIDWVDRQLGVAVRDQWMYVCNRFQVAAYDLERRQRVWQSAAPGQPQLAQKSTFTATRPVVHQNRIYARLLYTANGSLVCIDRSQGQLLWSYSPAANDEIVSDPFPRREAVELLTLTRAEPQEAILRLVSLDPRTGFLWREREVLRLRDRWWQMRFCECTEWGDGLIAALGGVVVHIGAGGEIRWLRRQTILPADEEPQWAMQYFQPPLADQGRLYVAQPGVHLLECLNAECGELVWSRLQLDLQRIVGKLDRRLICQTGRGLMALNADDGAEQWFHSAEGIQVGLAYGGTGDLLYVTRVPVDDSHSRFRPRLVWLDMATGLVRGTHDLAELEEADPRVGPLVVYRDRLWTFWGNGQHDASRDVVELLPNRP